MRVSGVLLIGASVWVVNLNCALGAVAPPSAPAQNVRPELEPLRAGAAFEAGGQVARLRELKTLPFVESDYTKRFHFDSCDNPKLKELRERYQLAEVISPGVDEFDRQIRLMDWVHRRFKKFGRPTTERRGALEILRGIDNGETFFCSHYADVFASAAASVGWVDRELALRRHQGVAIGGSTEHTTTEIWSNQFGKWVMLDPTSNMYLEKDGIPLNAFEIRQEWFYEGGRGLVFVVGKERNRYRRSDLPVLLAHFQDFGDLAINPDELDKYGFIGYIPNTNLMDSGKDYARMFITLDDLCSGTRWHTRTVPAKPASDPYFPIGQAALTLRAGKEGVQVELQTMTPNFEAYQARIDDGTWNRCGAGFPWQLHPGVNRLEVRTVNRFGVCGPVSEAVVEVALAGVDK
ncbi:MAG: hypothetical protein AB9869_29710 [Verrucomicrobiia bacterium]